MAYTTINKSTDNFTPFTYSGNGSSRTVTGVGFQPDFFWIKQRSNNQSHMLWDALRGGNYYMGSNHQNASNNDVGTFTAASDGYSFGTDSAYNGSGQTYVGWNWKAGGTAPAITYVVKVVSDSGNKYRFDDFGTSAVTLDLQEGGTYTFDQADSSNSGHPLRFYTAADKTGGEYTTGVTTNGTPGSSGAYTRITVAASAPTLYYQCSNHAGMGGQANTNSTFGSSNFKGSVQSLVSENTDAGFSIVKYTGTGSGSATVGHGLGAKPKILLLKAITGSENWHWWQDTDNDGTANQRLVLNFQNANYNNYFTSFQNDTFTLPSLNDNGWSANGTEFIAYVFAEKLGYSKFNYYVGNGNADGPFVYTGFKPAMVIAKNITATQDWVIKDNKRPGFNQINDVLYPNGNYTEGHGADVDFLSNGFKMRSTANNINASGQVFIYMAFAEAPLVGSNNVPATAR